MKQVRILTGGLVLLAFAASACGDDGGGGNAGGAGGSITSGGSGGAGAGGGPAGGTGGTGGMPAAITGCSEADSSGALQIIAQSCALSGCHADSYGPVMTTNAAQAILDHSIVFCTELSGSSPVDTTNPANSYFIQKITATATPVPACPTSVFNTPMPPPDEGVNVKPLNDPLPPRLNQAEINCLTEWIIDIGTP